MRSWGVEWFGWHFGGLFVLLLWDRLSWEEMTLLESLSLMGLVLELSDRESLADLKIW